MADRGELYAVTDPETRRISIVPSVELFERAMAWAEVEGVELEEQDEKIVLRTSGVYSTRDAASALLGGVVTGWIKAGMPPA